MELTQMRYFLEVAQSLHITKSAEKLHIAQPALSQSIRRLERELGVPLFEARGRNIAITEYGSYLKSRLEPIINELDNIPSQMKLMANLINETVHINVLAASVIVTDAVVEYNKNHDMLNFKLLQNHNSELYNIEIHTDEYGKNEKNDDNTFICTEKIFLAVPANQKYRGRKSISPDEMKTESFISIMGYRQFRGICDNYCKNMGFTPNVIFESDNISAVINMIESNMGVGFWPEFTWGQLENENILLLEIDGITDFRRDIIISHKENKSDNTNVKKVFDYICEYFNRRKNAMLYSENTHTVI